MPSFDVVSEMNLQEVDNAVNQTAKEILNRFDFRGTESHLSLDKDKKLITILSNAEQKIETVVDLLRGRAIKRGIDIKGLEVGKTAPTAGRQVRCDVKLVTGIETSAAKKITTFIRDSKLKVQAQIQGEQVRVTGKKRDDLQEAMTLLRGQDFGLPLQFNNFRD